MKYRTIAKVFALFLMAILAGSGANAQESGSLLKFITPEAFAAVVAYPSTVAAMPEMELMPKEIISAAGIKELGFDPLGVEEVILFAESSITQTGSDYCALIRLKNPVDAAKLFPGLSEQLDAATFAGKKGFKARSPEAPSIAIYDAKTIFVGPEPMLLKVLKPITAVSPLAAKIRALPSKSHATAIVLVEPVREFLTGQLANTPPLPPPLAELKNLPEWVDQVEIHANIGSAGTVKLALLSGERSSAEKVQTTITNAMDFGKEMLLAQTRQMDPEDPIQVATGKYTQRMSDHFQKLLSPKLNDKVVSLEIKNDSNSQVASVGVGVALLLPAVQAAREAARRMSSLNNLKQIALATHNYHDTFNRFPDQGAKAKDGKPLLSWRVHLLPFMEGSELYDKFHLDEPWDSEHNKKLIDQMPAVYRAPGSRLTNKTHYLAPLGEGVGFESGEKIGFASITDGTSNTIMVVEASEERAVIWTKPDDYEIDLENPTKGLTGLRPGGFQVALFDGSVRFISQNVDAATLKAMFTRAGGEVYKAP